MDDMTRGERLAVWVAGRLPQPLLAYPERVLINVACILIGVAAFAPVDSAVLDPWPLWLRLSWGISMIVGGTAALHGFWADYRPTERLGVLAIIYGCLLFFGGLVASVGFAGTITALVFLGIAAAKAIRLVRSVAVEAYRKRHARNGDLPVVDGETYS